MKRTLLALFAAAFALAAQTPQPAPIDKAKVEGYLRHLYVYPDVIKMEISDPKPSPVPGFREVNVRASYNASSEDRTFLVSTDGKKILDAKVYDLTENPFKEDLSLLKTAGAPSMGTAGAPVVLVMFSDFQCPYCKNEAQMIREKLLAEYPKQVRLYFKDMPLQSIHPWARTGALAGRCALAQGEETFWKYHDWMYAHQESITLDNFSAKMDDLAKDVPLDKTRFEACRVAPETQAALEAGLAEAKALKINSTPTMFINGRRIATTLRWEGLKQVVDFEIGYQAREHNAGEAECCMLAPLSPLGAAK
jgi:protein-disulfide isomerase